MGKKQETMDAKKIRTTQKTHLEDASKLLILKIHKEQNCGAIRLESIIDHKFGKHIPHNAIHQVLLENGLASENKEKEET